MVDVAPGSEKAHVQVKDVAAALSPDRSRAPVLNEKVVAMNELLKKGKGESIFKAAVAEKDDDMFVNFTEMRQIVDSEKDKTKPDDDQSERWKRLNQRVNIYDKWLNGNLKDLTPEEGLDVRQVLVEIPGFCDAIAVATGGRLSFDQVKNYLTGRGGAAVNADEKKVISEILGKFLGDDELRRRIEKSLSGLSSTIPEDDYKTSQQINALKDEIREKEALTQKKGELEEVVRKFKDLPADEKQESEDLMVQINEALPNINAKYKPAQTLASIDGNMQALKRELQEVTSQVTLLKPPAGNKDVALSNAYIEKLNEQAALKQSEYQLSRLHDIFQNPENVKKIKLLKDSTGAEEKLKSDINPKLREIADKERQIVDLEGKRNKYADKYKRKLERTLSEEMKRYWNDVKLKDAAAASEAEAAQKEQEKKEAKDLEELRKSKARDLLTRYLRMSFLKYKGDKVVGWEDKDLKNFVHRDMLSQSPTEIARNLLERIHDRTGEMPSRFEEEMNKTLKEMGLGKGTPPLTFDQLLKSMSDETYRDLAKDFVPDMMGYAQARGYYFDRMKLTKGEAEFLQLNYTPEFFVKMLESKKGQLELMQKLTKDDLLRGGLTEDNIRKIIGKDWTQGARRLLKATAVAGALGAGLYGGISFLGAGSYSAGLATLGGVGEAGAHVVGVASTAVTEGVRTASNAVTKAAADFEVGHALFQTPVETRNVQQEILDKLHKLQAAAKP